MSLFKLIQRIVTEFALIISVIASVLVPGVSQGNTVRIMLSHPCQRFDSWGTSGAWWSQHVGNSAVDEQVAELLFDKESGLGLQIYRYNIGGGEAENPNSRIWGNWTKTESFYVLNEQTGKYELDFSRDANARKMMDLAVQKGATGIILFCNSPHFSMTASGQASGGLTANSSNLPRENYQEFVDYVLAVADHFVSLGYPIRAVSPINEPQWGWGGEWVGQEGCHYSPEETVDLLELFAINMIKRRSPYALSGPENGAMSKDWFDYQKKYFLSPILNYYCNTYSGHSYWMDNDIEGKREAGRRFALHFPGKKFEMSEWCELPCKLDSNSIDSALYMANIIQQDLTLLNAASWQSWTAVSRHKETGGTVISDTLLRVDPAYTAVRYNKRYFAYRHFTSNVEPGAVRVRVHTGDLLSEIAAVAFKNCGKLTLVLINNEEVDTLVQLKNTGAHMRVFTTDAVRNYEQTYDGACLSALSLPARSITTVVIKTGI
ncbi:MAG: glycoside hydrolase [Acutalibacteraceae bacterium]|jgi:O-glycosyl hydrolase